MKRCSKCQKTLPLDSFYMQRKGGTHQRQALCKSCQAPAARAWQKANKDRVKIHDRKKSLRARYGPDAVERYEMLYEAQGGCCAICRKPERIVGEDGRATRLAMDHCHETGQVRGLLCRSCNVTLGQVGDTIAKVRNLLDYVENPPGYALPADVSRPKRWARDWDACQGCGSTDQRHMARGLCHACYERLVVRPKNQAAKKATAQMTS